MDAVLSSKSLPPGFRFHPTDEELFMYYLKRKVIGKSLGPQMMSEVNVYQFAPWELPAKACLKTRDLNWYFLCPRPAKYPNAGRSNRATVHGYWKSTGNDRIVNFKNRPVGKIKTLIFHRGKAPKGDRTDWVMHEYKLEDNTLLEKGIALDSYVICKIYEKSGWGPKNGENYGAAFVEEQWDSDIDDNMKAGDGLVLHPGRESLAIADGNRSVITSTMTGQFSAGPTTPSLVQQTPCATATDRLPSVEFEEDELDRLLAAFTEDHSNQIPDNEVYNGLEDLAVWNSNSEADFDWSQFLSEDCYLELKDLQH